MNHLIRTVFLIAISHLLVHSISAQDTIWVRKNAPTIKETYAVSFSADCGKIISGSECSPAYLRTFTTASGNVEWEYELGGTYMCVSGVKMSADGQRAAAMEEFGNLLIFDYSGATPVLLNTIATGTSGAFALDFSPDGTKIVTGCTDKKMNIYSTETGDLLHSVDAHSNWVMAVDWADDGIHIATSGSDNTVKIWDSTATLLKTLTGHTGAVQSVKFSNDAQHVVSGGRDDRIRIWKWATAEPAKILSGHTADIMQVAVANDNSFIASASADTYVKLWHFNSGMEYASFRLAGASTVFSVDIAPDNTKLVAGTANGDVQLWNIVDVAVVREDVNSSFVLYPNPATNYIRISAPSTIISTTIVNSLGEEVARYYANAKEKEINITALVPGKYYIKTTTISGKVFVEQFLKQ